MNYNEINLIICGNEESRGKLITAKVIDKYRSLSHEEDVYLCVCTKTYKVYHIPCRRVRTVVLTVL